MPGMPPSTQTGNTTGDEKTEKALLLKLLTKYHPELVDTYNKAEKTS